MSAPRYIREPCLEWIVKGIKTYEGMLYDTITEWDLYVGKHITFYNGNKMVNVEITSLPVYPDFGIAYDALGHRLMPKYTREETIDIYNAIYHYEDEFLKEGVTSKRIKKHGVVAIGFRLLSVTYL